MVGSGIPSLAPNPEPIPEKSRYRRYHLLDTTGIIYPGQVNTQTGVGNGINPPTPITYSGNEYTSSPQKMTIQSVQQA